MLYVHSPQQMRNLDEIIAKYGLNAPIWKQYWTWLVQVFHGNLGWSQVVGMPVTSAIASFLPATLELAIFATPLIIFLGIFLGTKAAAHKDSWIDHVTRVGAIVGWSLPTFWLGLMLLMVFYGFFSGFLPPERLGNAMDAIVHSSSFVRYTGIEFSRRYFELEMGCYHRCFETPCLTGNYVYRGQYGIHYALDAFQHAGITLAKGMY